MVEKKPKTKGKGGGSGGGKPKPACTVFVQGNCTGVGCSCPASGGAR